jgi:AAA+ superfamily predicted ATPase
LRAEKFILRRIQQVVWTEVTGSHLGEKFSTSLEHILAELERIELRLNFRVKARRLEGASGGDAFRSFCISEKEVDILERNFTFLGERLSSGAQDPALQTFLEADRELQQTIDKRKQELLNQGLELRLDRLVRLYGLSRTEIDILLICLLPEIDSGYQRIYAYLQDDITKKMPTVGLVLQLLCDSLESAVKLRDIFSAGAPLIKNQMLELGDDRTNRQTPLPARILRLDERISAYLLGSDRLDARLHGCSRLAETRVELPDLVPDEIRLRLPGLVSGCRDRGLVIHIHGPDRDSLKAAAGLVCASLEKPLLYIDLERIQAPDASPETLLPLVFREGILQKALLYFNGWDLFFDADKSHKAAYASLITELNNYPYWVFLAGEKEWFPGDLLGRKPCINIGLIPPSYLERKQTWEKYINHESALVQDINLADIAAKFQLGSGQIRDVIATARNLALWRNPQKIEVSSEDIYSLCRQLSGKTLEALARRVNSSFQWEDIVLPPDQVEQLHEICSYIEYYQTVYSDWGFGRKLSTGKGLNVLFAGPSGTGKTMAAGIIARELKLDLYRVDLSLVVSKYIGETEKNLEHIFQEGRTSNAILFFDEADALFGKRSEVKDAHDRYANIEIAYLLQKMDEYEGIVIMATNLRKNMDEAFARRIQFAVEFPLPDETDRLRIWKIIFPAEAPLAPDVDLSFMSQFKISGGNIKNIALYSAFLAVRDRGIIRMEHLIRATRREYQKIGRLCTEDEFAQYFKLAKLQNPEDQAWGEGKVTH